MGIRTLILTDGREVVVRSIDISLEGLTLPPFATLLPASDEKERRQVGAIAGKLVALGCKEFCCAGPQAEDLHDSIDEIVEESGALGMVTTWHTDYFEACEYFLFGAGGGALSLLALVENHPAVVGLLEDVARDQAEEP